MTINRAEFYVQIAQSTQDGRPKIYDIIPDEITFNKKDIEIEVADHIAIHFIEKVFQSFRLVILSPLNKAYQTTQKKIKSIVHNQQALDRNAS